MHEILLFDKDYYKSVYPRPSGITLTPAHNALLIKEVNIQHDARLPIDLITPAILSLCEDCFFHKICSPSVFHSFFKNPQIQGQFAGSESCSLADKFIKTTDIVRFSRQDE